MVDPVLPPCLAGLESVRSEISIAAQSGERVAYFTHEANNLATAAYAWRMLYPGEQAILELRVCRLIEEWRNR